MKGREWEVTGSLLSPGVWLRTYRYGCGHIPEARCAVAIVFKISVFI